MPEVTTFASQNFDLGIKRDDPRDQLPRGAAFDMVDYIPRDGAPLRKRGGWALASKDLNSLAACTRVTSVAWAPFPTNPRLLMVSDNAKLFESIGPIDDTHGTYIAAIQPDGLSPENSAFWHKAQMVFPISYQTVSPGVDNRLYDGTSVTTLPTTPGNPPRGRVGWSWGDYLVLANGWDPSSAYALRKSRLWYSQVGVLNFDTTASGGIWDMPDEVVAGVVLRSVQLVWGYAKTWALTGDTPPPGGNLARRDLFNIGCMDGRSVTTWRDFAIWANQSGVWRTDGATLTDLTYNGGICLYWRSLVSSFNFSSGWKAAAGIFYNHYIITITDNNGVNVVTLACDLETLVWFRIKNLPTTGFAWRPGGPGTANESGSEELFAAWYGGPRAMRLSGFWSPSSANAYDGDGAAVLPVLETGFYKSGSTDHKRFRRAYLGYELIAAGGAPKLALGYVLSPESVAYVEPLGADGSIISWPANTKFDRKYRPVARAANGIALRLRQTDASYDTRIAELEFSGHAWNTVR